MRLEELRNKKGWSQAALAAKLGVTREYLARLEGGQHDPPLSTVERLAKILGVRISNSWSERRRPMGEIEATPTRTNAPRGVFRHESGLWVVRFTCGGGHIHEERVGTVKSEAIQRHHERRGRSLSEPGWCPRPERDAARAAGVIFRAYAADYEAWARDAHRSFRNTQSELRRLTAHLGDRPLARITHGDVERFVRGLTEGPNAVTASTANRYRDRISGLYQRALRLGLVASNPAKGIRKAKEPGGRVVYLTFVEETAVRDELAPDLRRLFTFSLHTGLRWSEQAGLRWADVDMLAGAITIGRSKNGRTRRVPLNSTASSILVDLGAARTPHSDPEELVFLGAAYRTVSRAFVAPVGLAQAALRAAGKDAGRLEGYTWHGNRHTFASRLVMAGVDLLTVQTLGGWRTPAMVQRYAHLAPEYLARAVERLVAPRAAVELGRNLDGAGVVERVAP
jgi:integrase/DNA-binding XRE family transcriptional regulator